MLKLRWMSVCAVAAGVMGGLCASIAGAQVTITQWNFNSVPADANTGTGVTTPAIGLGTASTFGGIAASFSSGSANGGSSDPAPSSDNSGWQTTTYAAQGTETGGRGVQFAVSTAGFQDITVTFDTRHSNTSSRFVQVYYTTNGTTYIAAGAPFEATTGGDTWYNARTVDLTGISGVGNNASFAIRIAPVFAPSTTAYTASTTTSTYASTGTLRYDMVTVSGTPTSTTNPTGTAQATPAAVCNTGSSLVLSVAVQPGQAPTSTGIAVSANLANLGGGTVQLLDDGVAPDLAAGDNIFTVSIPSIGSGQSVGARNVTFDISDAQARSGSTSTTVNVVDCSALSTSKVVISQVFGGGGNSGPPVGTYNADYIELFNRSNVVVDLTGWSVQYAGPTAAGGFDAVSDKVDLSGSIAPGQRVLVRMSDPDPLVGSPLPTPDFINTSQISGLGNTGGRVALVKNQNLLLTNCNAPDTIIEDLVGYGLSATCFEGGAPTANTANDAAAIRKNNGNQDTNQSFNDFAIATPLPSNRSAGGFLAGYASADSSVICAGSPVAITVNAVGATGAPGPSTGISVRADLSPIGGGANVALSGSGPYTISPTILGSTAPGLKSIKITTTDAQGRSDISYLTFNVVTCVSSSAPVVISQFTGGGGNLTSPFNADFVEIFNRSSSPQDLTGWSLQYTDALPNVNGFVANRVISFSATLQSGSSLVMAPGSYRLIQVSTPGTGGVALPAPDFIQTPGFGMDNQFGTIAIVNSTTPLGANNCGAASIVDLVGYGPTAYCREGDFPTSILSNQVFAKRRFEGCQDFNQNAVDFDVFAPLFAPRNSASPANLCAVSASFALNVTKRGGGTGTVASNDGIILCGAICGNTYTSGTQVVLTATPVANSRFVGWSGDCTGTGPCIVNMTQVRNVSARFRCQSDFNDSGTVSVQDILDFVTAWLAGCTGPGTPAVACSGSADFNGQNGVTVQDLLDFFTAWLAGC